MATEKYNFDKKLGSESGPGWNRIRIRNNRIEGPHTEGQLITDPPDPGPRHCVCVCVRLNSKN